MPGKGQDRVAELPNLGIAPGNIRRHGSPNDGVECIGQARSHCLDRDGRLRHHLVQDLEQRIPVVRFLAGKELVENHADRIHIAPRVDSAFSARLLR
jgi:hypothetical protein